MALPQGYTQSLVGPDTTGPMGTSVMHKKSLKEKKEKNKTITFLKSQDCYVMYLLHNLSPLPVEISSEIGGRTSITRSCLTAELQRCGVSRAFIS